MALYQHPHLTRGVVHTPMGAFTVNRGIVELPDEIGESLGWTAVSESAWSPSADARVRPADFAPVAANRTASR